MLDLPTLALKDVPRYLNGRASRTQILELYRQAQDQLISWKDILCKTGPLFVSTQDVEASADCLEVAMHSHQHIPLARLTAEEFEEELALSRHVVSNLGLPQVNAVAPPYGGLGTTYSAAQLIQL